MGKSVYQQWLEDDKLALIEGWARGGLTDEQIALNMGIHVATLYKWKKLYKPIDEALKNGKDVADTRIENAMYKSACGYYVTEMEQKLDNAGRIHDTLKRRWIPPNVTAQIFWLKNRRSSFWRDKPVEIIDSDSSGRQQFIEAVSGEVTRESVEKLYDDDGGEQQ